MPEAKIPVAHEGSGAMVVTTGIFDPRIFDHKVYHVGEIRPPEVLPPPGVLRFGYPAYIPNRW